MYERKNNKLVQARIRTRCIICYVQHESSMKGVYSPSCVCLCVSLRKELIWHLTHLLVFLHQSLIFELLVRSLQAP